MSLSMCACGHLVTSHTPDVRACYACAGPSCDVTFSRCALCGDWEYLRAGEDTSRHVQTGHFVCDVSSSPGAAPGARRPQQGRTIGPVAVRTAEQGRRITKAVQRVERYEWRPDVPRSAHADHRYDGACAVCRSDVAAILRVSVGLEPYPADEGNLAP